MTYQYIAVERQGDVAIIRLNDPATLNAVSLQMIEELDSALTAAECDARAILLTGMGRGFSSGANLGKTLDPLADGYDGGAALQSRINRLMLKIRDLRIPFVTAVNGAAAGVGAAIALSGDLVIASETAYILEAFCRIGLVPDGGSAFLLIRAVGRPRAMEMMLLGEKINAAQALEWGLVNRVVPDALLPETALAFATSLASGPTYALGLIRRMGWQATQLGFDEMLEIELEMQQDAGTKADHREGITAFLQKRPPRFDGK